MSGRAELSALVKRACHGNEPDNAKKREVGDALRKHPESASDLWSVFKPHLTSEDPSERFLALDCLYECLSSVKPDLPRSDLDKFKDAAKEIRDDEREGGKETAARLLDDKALWDKLSGGGGGGKHGGGDGHDGPGKGGGKHGGAEHDDDKHGHGGGKGGKHGDDDDKHGHGGGGKGGGGGKHGDDDDKHGHGGGGHGKGGGGKHGDDDDKHGHGGSGGGHGKKHGGH